MLRHSREEHTDRAQPVTLQRRQTSWPEEPCLVSCTVSSLRSTITMSEPNSGHGAPRLMVGPSIWKWLFARHHSPSMRSASASVSRIARSDAPGELEHASNSSAGLPAHHGTSDLNGRCTHDSGQTCAVPLTDEVGQFMSLLHTQSARHGQPRGFPTVRVMCAEPGGSYAL